MVSKDDFEGSPGDLISMQAQKDLVTSAMVDAEIDSVGMPSDLAGCRDNWALYHLIGDALRRDAAVHSVSPVFTARISAALEREAPHALSAQSVQTHRPARAWRLKQIFGAWPGLAVAAAVTSVVWVAEPILGLGGTIQSGAAMVTRGAANQTTLMVEARPELDYVSAHRQLASPIAVRDVGFMPRAN